ncbi:MAG TPA: hypothetical protein VEX86_18260 [Longimicrobium sp.]|nr:hypothetical protein [Longimicrobium sp.]
MTQTAQSRGLCAYCEREMTRGGMNRHLRACDQRALVMEDADGKAGKIVPLVHLQVRDAWTGRYWINLEVDGSAALRELDDYLRAIWLECCGHLSRFSVGRWGQDEIPTSTKMGRVFRPGAELTHTYDFGSATVTRVKVVEVREGTRTTGRPIALMARNAPLACHCQECGRPAASLCLECSNTGRRGTLCDEHAAAHPHEDCGAPVELVNSPRLGMCVYTGPAEPPY